MASAGVSGIIGEHGRHVNIHPQSRLHQDGIQMDGEYDLQDRQAIVTGASRGIGQAIAVALADAGMHVLGTGRDEAALAQTRALRPERIQTRVCDLEQPDSIAALVRHARGLWDRLDLLVNNAGFGVFGPATETSLEDWDRVFAVNARGTFQLSREVFAWMRDSGGGRIVNISSVVGLRGYVDQVAYASAKHAMMGFTKVMAREGQAHNIRVTAVCPGGVATDLVRQARPDLDPTTLIQPADVARAVLFLAAMPETCCTDYLELRRAGSTPFP
jgi:3-oxoacyl-[acyl-carrier protein] reductase